MKIFKKFDLVIYAAILSAALISALLFWRGEKGKRLELTVNNKHHSSYSLSTDGSFKIKTNRGCNTLVISGGEAWFENSDCPDKTCQSMGKISSLGQTVVCLPNGVVAEVVE